MNNTPMKNKDLKDRDFKQALAAIRTQVPLQKKPAAHKKQLLDTHACETESALPKATAVQEQSFKDLLNTHHSNSGHVKPLSEKYSATKQHKDFGAKPPPVKKIQHSALEEFAVENFGTTDFTAEMLTYGESIQYLKQGHSKKLLSKLKRNQYRIDYTIDLHGYFLKDATIAIHKLLHDAINQQHHVIRIIHGKGKHSSNKGPVLKSMLNQQLRLRDDVIAFCTAPAHDGGTGVLYCLLDWH
jgi:DNA-nicking Smr family endonuclease